MKREKFHVFIIKIKSLAITAFLCVCGVLLICFSTDVGSGIKNGLMVSATVLIPSLFPFMIFSSFLLKTRAQKVISYILKPVTKYLFGIDYKAGAVILLSFIGGYPIGAGLISQMKERKEISEKTACRLLYFCINAGPAFMTIAVGVNMFRSLKIGLILLFSQLMGSVIIAVATRFLLGSSVNKSESHIIKLESLSVSFVKAVSEASTAILTVCTFVTAFGGLLGLMSSVNLPEYFSRILSFIGLTPEFSSALFTGFFEVTSGCAAASQIRNIYSSVMLAAFLTSFGGLCVLFQIKSFLSSANIRVKYFFSTRVLHGLLSAFISRLLLHFINTEVSAAVSISKPVPILASMSVPASIALILMCIAVILTTGKNQHSN